MRVSILSALVLLASGCGTIRSTVGIDPGETFVLGGGQAGAFSAELLNVGTVSVGIAEVLASGDTLVVATLASGEGTRARFAAGSAALLVNRSAREAAVQAVVRGDTNLGMRYTPVD